MTKIAASFDATSKVIDAETGFSLMEALRAADLPVQALCGGACSCATCHVYVDAAFLSRLPLASAEEEELLGDAREVRHNSRLACQIPVTADLEGMSVELAPDAIAG